MAFDVYVGTFTRFYTRQWENVVQKQAKTEGWHYQMIYAGGDSGPPAAEEVLEGVSGWRRAMNEGLAPHGLGPIEWSEDEGQAYFTDRPGWEGYSGLLLWAAYAQSREATTPLALPEVWAEDSIYQAVVQLEKPRFPAVLMANVWLPGDFEFHFKFPPLVGEAEVMIASTSSLLNDLHDSPQTNRTGGSPPFLRDSARERIKCRLSRPLERGWAFSHPWHNTLSTTVFHSYFHSEKVRCRSCRLTFRSTRTPCGVRPLRGQVPQVAGQLCVSQMRSTTAILAACLLTACAALRWPVAESGRWLSNDDFFRLQKEIGSAKQLTDDLSGAAEVRKVASDAAREWARQWNTEDRAHHWWAGDVRLLREGELVAMVHVAVTLWSSRDGRGNAVFEDELTSYLVVFEKSKGKWSVRHIYELRQKGRVVT